MWQVLIRYRQKVVLQVQFVFVFLGHLLWARKSNPEVKNSIFMPRYPGNPAMQTSRQIER